MHITRYTMITQTVMERHLLILLFHWILITSTTRLLPKQKNGGLLRFRMTSGDSLNIQVFSRSGCKYCRMAKSTLDRLNVSWVNVDIEDDSGELDDLSQIRKNFTLTTTVPQIFFGTDHIGGYDALRMEVESGAFSERLSRSNLRYAQKTTIHQEKIQSNRLSNEHLISCSMKRDFLNFNIYGIDLADLYIMNAVELSKQIQKRALKLTDLFASQDGKRVKYGLMRESKEFADYIDLSFRLQNYNISELRQALSDKQRLSFFVNLYNALIIHANCVLGPPADTPAARGDFFSGRSGALYNIGGHIFSPDDIEHGLIRGNSPHPSKKNDRNSYFDYDDPRAVLAVSNLDPRIHFILNCGAQSCPPIKILGEDPEAALAAAAAAYLDSEISVNETTRTLMLPKLVLWYGDDFGPTLAARIRTVVNMMSRENANMIRLKLEHIGYNLNDRTVGDSSVTCTVAYNEYSWAVNDESSS